MLHKPTISHHTHRSLSHEDAERTGVRHVSSNTYTRRICASMRQKMERWKTVYQNGNTQNGHIRTYLDLIHFIPQRSQEFETSDEIFQKYGKRQTIKR